MSENPDTGAVARDESAEDTRFTSIRLTVPVPGAREFKLAYEAAAPDVPSDRVTSIWSESNDPWSWARLLMSSLENTLCR